MREIVKALVPDRYRRSTRLKAYLAERSNGRVMFGPFRGMRYVERSYGSEYWPKLLGTYENEIASPLAEAIGRNPERMVVVGAAEGYYAVGLLRLLPKAQMIAFEAVPEARAILARMAEMNSVNERIEIRGICDLEGLRAALDGDARKLMIVDIEGVEAVLMDPHAIPSLLRAEIIMELHDCLVPGVTALIWSRFEGSHRIEHIEQRPRGFSDVPEVPIPPAWCGAMVQLLQERRPAGNDWLHLIPR